MVIPGIDPAEEAVRPPAYERRKTIRVALHWTVYLVCGETRYPLRSVTRNISRDGFYCLIGQPLKPGERLQCDIVLPAHCSPDPAGAVYLRCQVQAVRVEMIGRAGGYGVAFRIEDYHLVQGASHPAGDNPGLAIPKI